MSTGMIDHVKTRGLKVIIVDDDPAVLNSLQFALEIEGFTVHVYGSGDALLGAEMTQDGCLVLDYNMPGFSGLETLSEFKREKRRVAVVMITSSDDEALAERARALGAAFLKKPFFPIDIERALCRYYGLRAVNPGAA